MLLFLLKFRFLEFWLPLSRFAPYLAYSSLSRTVWWNYESSVWNGLITWFYILAAYVSFFMSLLVVYFSMVLKISMKTKTKTLFDPASIGAQKECLDSLWSISLGLKSTQSLNLASSKYIRCFLRPPVPYGKNKKKIRRRIVPS